jgi:hypothetical protein
MAHATPVTSDIAHLKRGECEGRTIAASSHNSKDRAGPLRTGGLSRSAGSSQEGRPEDGSDEISGATEGETRHCNGVRTGLSLALGVRGVPEISPAQIN